ncbi:hypothetical protein COOONC_23634 [Cooperia oncophora]
MLVLLMHLLCAVGSILATTLCAEKREVRTSDHMPASKRQTQRSIMVVASSTSATTQSTEKVGKKVDSNEGKKQEKKEKSAEKLPRK